MTGPPPELPLFVVLNAASGREGGEARRATIERVLGEAGRPHEVIVVDAPASLADATRRALERAREHGGAVVAAGGDGTINAVTQAVLGSGRPMGILPQGTFNYFGRAHGVSTDTEAAVRALLRARPSPVRIGRVNGRVFLVNASVGLYPEVLQDREAWKRRWGRTRAIALLAGLLTVLRGVRPLRLAVSAGGTERDLRTTTLFVGNNPLQLERIGLPVDETIGDGRLAAIVVPPIGPAGLLWLALRGALGELGEASTLLRFDVERMTVRASRLSPRRRIVVATDGELATLALPLRFEVAPEPLALLVPDAADAVPPA